MHAATFAGGIKLHGGAVTVSYDGRRAAKLFLAIIIGASGVGGITITTVGFAVQATETTQATMNATFMFERKL